MDLLSVGEYRVVPAVDRRRGDGPNPYASVHVTPRTDRITVTTAAMEAIDEVNGNPDRAMIDMMSSCALY